MSEQPTPADLTAILTAHQFREDPPPLGPRCHCGFRPYGLTEHRHAAHVAEQITAAGFGPVRAAEAERDALLQQQPFRVAEANRVRAEQAEAREKALWESVEALAERYAAEGAARDAAGRPAWPNNVARDLRALLKEGAVK